MVNFEGTYTDPDMYFGTFLFVLWASHAFNGTLLDIGDDSTPPVTTPSVGQIWPRAVDIQP